MRRFPLCGLMILGALLVPEAALAADDCQATIHGTLMREEESDTKTTYTGTDSSPAVTTTYTKLESGGSTVKTETTRSSMTVRYDSSGRVLKSTTPLRVVDYDRDGNGKVERIDSTEDGNTYWQSFTYDNLEHTKSQSDGVGKLFDFTPRRDGSSGRRPPTCVPTPRRPRLRLALISPAPAVPSDPATGARALAPRAGWRSRASTRGPASDARPAAAPTAPAQRCRAAR